MGLELPCEQCHAHVHCRGEHLSACSPPRPQLTEIGGNRWAPLLITGSAALPPQCPGRGLLICLQSCLRVTQPSGLVLVEVMSKHSWHYGERGSRRYVSFPFKDRYQSSLTLLVCKKHQPQGPWGDFCPVAQTVSVQWRGVGFREEDWSRAVPGAEVKVEWSPTAVLFRWVGSSPPSPPRTEASTGPSPWLHGPGWTGQRGEGICPKSQSWGWGQNQSSGPLVRSLFSALPGPVAPFYSR